MKASIPQPAHESYLKHRKQRTWQILVPVIASAVLCLVMVLLVTTAAFGGADVALWAQISEIWIAIPTMLIFLVIFALLAGMVFLMAKLLSILPTYTFRAQDLTYRLKAAVRRAADAAAKPVITIDALGASINRILGKR